MSTRHHSPSGSSQEAHAKDDERATIERREDLERELTYAKSEIGTVAGRLLKYTPFPRRVAIISAVVVLALGVGVTVGVHQIRSVFGSGDGVIEKVTGEDSQTEELPAGDDTDTNEDANEDTDEDADTDSDDVFELTQENFTKEADGIWRVHIKATPLPYRETLADHYYFPLPDELRKPSEPYVAHVHTQRRPDVTNRYSAAIDIMFSNGGDPYFHDTQRLYKLPDDVGNEEGDSHDVTFPLALVNPYLDEEIDQLRLFSNGADVDIELLPVSQVSLRTWDGHSKLEQEEAELFRVTGPITATSVNHNQQGLGGRCYAWVYGWRPGDPTFTLLADAVQTPSAELTGDEFATGSYTLDGIELLWVTTKRGYCSTPWTISSGD